MVGGDSALVAADTACDQASGAPMSLAANESSSSSTSTGDEDDSNNNKHLICVEYSLPSGDFYKGQFLGGRPHGAGKYLWTDGCSYDGDWRHGNASGQGTFSWPSGSTYKGEFKDGCMDGHGEYIGKDRSIYRGFWSRNHKHGRGKKIYHNGDVYDGHWRAGKQDGDGQYTWRYNNNQYIGFWRAGFIHGYGTLLFTEEDNRYDGGWKDGNPSGQGSFTWADGSVYVGYWTRDSGGGIPQVTGTYYASPTASSLTPRDPRQELARLLPTSIPGTSESASLEEGRSGIRLGSIFEELDVLERMLKGSEKPQNLSLSILKYITNDFSHERKIGNGGCGEVYKGFLQNGTVAVKKLFSRFTIEDKQFNQEAESMMRVQHQNIVRFIGYCSNTEHKAIEVEGKFIMAEVRERLLCFEYVNNGSLDSHLTDELRGLEWNTRYKIIKGICEGLHHLHKEKRIIHMDLKPENILLDDHMVPKIADFGLSRLDEISQTRSDERLFSLGYCAPEYQSCGKMSLKSDIYSLGIIIIELMTGSKEEPDITKTLRRWRHRWDKSGQHILLEYQQVTTCIELALSCKEIEPARRPFIWDILAALNTMESMIFNKSQIDQKISCLEDMLGIEPLELHFPFESNQLMSCLLHLTNNTDDYIVFNIQATNPQQYCIEPKRDGVPPRSKCSVTITVQAQEQAPKPKHCVEELIVQSTRVDEGIPTQDMIEDLFDEQKNNKSVDKVSLTVVFDEPQAPEEPEHELLNAPLEREGSKYQGTRKASTIKAEMKVSVQTSSQGERWKLRFMRWICSAQKGRRNN